MRRHFFYKSILTFALAVSTNLPAFAADAAPDAGTAGAPGAAGTTDAPEAGSCNAGNLDKASLGACKDLVQKCFDAGQKTAKTQEAGSIVAGATADNKELYNAQQQMRDTSAGSGTAFSQAALDCKKSVSSCTKTCGSKKNKDAQTCEDTLKKLASCYENQATSLASTAGGYQKSLDPQSANSQAKPTPASAESTASNPASSTPAPAAGSGGGGAGSGGASSGGGMGSTMQQMMPILAMLGVAAMTANSGSSSASAVPNDPNAALQPNGSLDCSKPDGFVYRNCAEIISATCTSEIISKAYYSDQNCLNFGARYCANSGAAAAVATSAPGLPPISSPGEGAATSFCQQVTAVNFCQNSGTSLCPSCLQLQKIQSSTCISNPASCTGQSSSAAASAATAAMCPVRDPGTSLAIASIATTAAPTSLIFVPASVQAAMAGGSNKFSVASIPSDVATREGLASGGSNVQNYAGGSNARSLASSTGSIQVASVSQNLNSNSVSRGPASDVQSEYGSNIFNMGSEIYRQRCAQGKLNNCP